MTRIFKLASIHDIYEKLQRDGVALNDDVTIERVFNFVATAYFMVEWVKNDPSVSQIIKNHGIIDDLYNDHWLKVCGDLAAARQHFKLKNGDRKNNSQIMLDNGINFHCRDLVQGVLSSWRNFFTSHGMHMRAIL